MNDRKVTLRTPSPPAGHTFAAVQVEATNDDGETWRIVGAEPTRVPRRVDGEIVEVLKPEIHAACHLEPGDTQIRARWVFEDASRPPLITTHDPNARTRRLGGPR